MTHSVKKLFCIIYKANFIKTILDNDPNIYGLIFRKSSTSNKINIWELSPKMFMPFIEPIVVNDDDVKWAYVDKTNPAIFKYSGGDTIPDDKYNLQFFDTNPDFVLFSRENLLSILRKSDDNSLYISGAKIEYGLGRNDFRDASNNTVYPTLKAETKFTYSEKDQDDVYWNIDIGLPCPTLWQGAVAEIINKVKNETNESFTENPTHGFPKEIRAKDALKKIIDKLKEFK